ncbi:unnamed protein product [Protopolystoma xenopodis]|uniref:Uncharacterized protein n=1 Tax=Protopolystoma xenopodis TaxID=117903 RepID=A0A3S5FBV9_9PLAT|nr:unnamed protein product [Protopolystoma xenopodis]
MEECPVCGEEGQRRPVFVDDACSAGIPESIKAAEEIEIAALLSSARARTDESSDTVVTGKAPFSVAAELVCNSGTGVLELQDGRSSNQGRRHKWRNSKAVKNFRRFRLINQGRKNFGEKDDK